jgi:hypothetical protein
LGCYCGNAENKNGIGQLVPAAYAAVRKAAPNMAMHEETRSVSLSDLAQHFFAGHLELARLYYAACVQEPDPERYALTMMPFYLLSLPAVKGV